MGQRDGLLGERREGEGGLNLLPYLRASGHEYGGRDGLDFGVVTLDVGDGGARRRS